MESVLQMARLLSRAEEKEKAHRKRLRENNERAASRSDLPGTAGGANSDPDCSWEERLRRLREALWLALLPVSKEVADEIETDESTAKEVEVAWDPKLHIPRILRQKATRMLLEGFAHLEAFLKFLADEATVKELVRRLDAKGRRQQMTQLLLREVDLVELKRDEDFVLRVVKRAKEEEQKLYAGSKSKQVYRNLLSAMVSKLKVAPPLPDTKENTNKVEGGGEKEKTPQEPPASSEKELPKEVLIEMESVNHKEKKTQSQTSGNVVAKDAEEEGEDSDIEVQMSTRPHSLHQSKVRSQERDRSLVEMRCRHNRKVAGQLRQKIQKDRNVFRKLNHYLQVNQDLKNAAKWVEKIKYNSEMKRCGLVSSDEEEEDEEDEKEKGKVVEERSKEIERDVRDFIRGSLEKYVKQRSLSASDYDQIEEKATRKVMSKHRECKTSSFLKKKGTDIRKLLDKYLLACNKNGKQTHKHAPIPPPPPPPPL